ncbi:transcriptional regulator with XRE-family HTH domain [Rhodobium orientis]|uniref:HTH cro/C1-type domain-containing protein n=1 Tax=Rhodobium orientis TaxID=34017 RepID=A0A327JLP4_9HYPH|nr:helix-turn-helix transcriptional regulator [Rhodobium orientis]MBB4302832.1 transcriptional regulator with XRE-family HTH domain [Rhodobium orientis]RAI26263.1 hypothetical protein CH339_14860 [Rhodobium orientis]
MSKGFAFDLKVARHKSGLSQRDCAHLLDVHRSKISRIEQGHHPLGVEDICILTLLYGRPFESLFGSACEDVRPTLRKRLATLPAETGPRLSGLNRTHTLDLLAVRLDTLDTRDHGAA